MVLNFGGVQNLFTHSEEFEQGGGQIRKGMGTFVVALDGSGDFASIQEAINALPSTGGVVYIKEGTYTITASVTIPTDNIALIGSGASTIIYTTADIAIISSAKDFTTIRDLHLKGNSTGSNQHGIYLNAVDRTFINNCWIENTGGNGMYIVQASGYNVISENYIIGCELNAVYVYASTALSLGTILYNNIIRNIVRNGIYLYATGVAISITQSIISNNYISDCDVGNTTTYSGIALDTADSGVVSGIIIDNNYSRACDNYGIDIKDAAVAKTLIMGNTCLNNTTGQINDSGTNTHPNGASGTNNLALDDLNIIA